MTQASLCLRNFFWSKLLCFLFCLLGWWGSRFPALKIFYPLGISRWLMIKYSAICQVEVTGSGNCNFSCARNFLFIMSKSLKICNTRLKWGTTKWLKWNESWCENWLPAISLMQDIFSLIWTFSKITITSMLQSPGVLQNKNEWKTLKLLVVVLELVLSINLGLIRIKVSSIFELLK